MSSLLISRRQFLPALASVTFSLRNAFGEGNDANAIAKGPTNRAIKTATELATFMRSVGWLVSDHADFGGRVVLLAPDVHNKLYQQELMGMIQMLHAKFPFQVVGREGYVEGPESPKDLAIFKRAMGIIRGSEPTLEEQRELAKKHPYYPLFTDTKFKAVGIEPDDSEQAVRNFLAGSTASIIYRWSRVARSQGLLSPSEWDYDNRTIARATQYLRASDKTFPEFHPPSVDVTLIPGSVVFTSAGAKQLSTMLQETRAWIDTNLIASRNEIAVERFLKAMQEGNYNSGVILFGKRHMEREAGLPKPLQGFLADAKVGYVVLDLPKN